MERAAFSPNPHAHACDLGHFPVLDFKVTNNDAARFSTYHTSRLANCLYAVICIVTRIHKIELTSFFAFSASKETLPGLILLLISYFGILIPCYYLCEYTDYINFSVLDSFKSNYINLIVAGVLLAVSNPFLEEFFWRGFCPYVL